MPAIRTYGTLPSRSTKPRSTSCGISPHVSGATLKDGKVNWSPFPLPSMGATLESRGRRLGSGSTSAPKTTPKDIAASKETKEPKEVNPGPAHPENTFLVPKNTSITDYQKKVYALLLQIPPGNITTYAYLSAALGSSPRAIGNAMRRNPYAPDVPCHRCIASTGYIGGFMGDWRDAPSGLNIEKKLELLKGEGVEFDKDGFLKDKAQIWHNFDV